MIGRPSKRFERLSRLMLSATPACAGDDRFIADELAADDAAEMRGMCSTCPLVEACMDYARSSRPPAAGFWAGVSYPRPRGGRLTATAAEMTEDE